jgi:hypothetical protein
MGLIGSVATLPYLKLAEDRSWLDPPTPNGRVAHNARYAARDTANNDRGEAA